MARRPLTMSPNYLAVLRGVRDLHRLTVQGRDESPEADAIRDATDGPWDALTEPERKRISGLSEDLYSISDSVAETPRPSNPQAQERLDGAIVARDSGQWDRALEILRRWSKYVSPALLSYLRGSIWLAAGDPATAALFYGHAAEFEPGNGYYLGLALHSLDLAGSEEAVLRAEDVLDRNELYGPFVVVNACNIVLTKATRSASEAEGEAVCRRLIPVLNRELTRIETDINDGTDKTIYDMTVWLLGFAHEFLGNNQEAISLYSRGLLLDPNNEVLLTSRGVLLYGTSPLAIADFELAARQESPDVWPFFYLAHHYLVSGRFKESRAMCERGENTPAPDSVRSELAEWKAIAQSELGFPADMVRASFEEAIRLDPFNDRARRNFSLFEAAVRPVQHQSWETRQLKA